MSKKSQKIHIGDFLILWKHWDCYSASQCIRKHCSFPIHYSNTKIPFSLLTRFPTPFSVTLSFSFSSQHLSSMLQTPMVATNILSLNHLSSAVQTPKRPPSPAPVPDPPPLRQISSYTPTSPLSPPLATTTRTSSTGT